MLKKEKWNRAEGRLNRISFCSSELIGLGEEKAELSTDLVFLEAQFGKKFSLQKILAMPSKALYWGIRGYLHTYIHSTGQFFPRHLEEKVPQTLKVTCGNPGPRRINQKAQGQD